MQAYRAQKNVTSATRFLQYYLLMAGWGRADVSEDSGGRTLRVRVEDNFFAQASENDTGNPSCFFLSGFMAGMTESLFDEDCSCMENKCMSSGAKACEFIVKRMAPQHSGADAHQSF